MNATHPPARKLLHSVIALLLCFAPPAVSAFAHATTPQAGNHTVQSCSYDGSSINLSILGMTDGQSEAGAQVVSEIMRFTGLPQNFQVYPHPEVPNAAAIILLGPDKLPKRVIVYNEKFIQDVRQSTANNNWAPISIMAHEIGHHLCGHTILPGGSQPPSELEADKFSGYVLFKMGAKLSDATRAINALVGEQDSKTHPGRAKRLRAISEGWAQACQQQSKNCASDEAAPVTPIPPNLGTPPSPEKTPAVIQGTEATVQLPAEKPLEPVMTAAQTPPPAAPAVASPVATDVIDTLPAPDLQAIPLKLGKFVIDEMGILDKAARAAFEKRMFDLATQHQVELVTIISKNLHGLTADDYALAMMRQLRVGKLDVGNGAVLVVAPHEKQVGIAMGPGILLEMHDYLDLEKERLKNFIEFSLSICQGTCKAEQTGMLFHAAAHIADMVKNWDFTIRYQSLAEILAAFAESEKVRQRADYDPEKDPVWRKITRLSARLVSRNAATGSQVKGINEAHVALAGGAPLHMISDEGRNILVYINPQIEKLMTSPLVEGQHYMLIAREVGLSDKPDEVISVDLLSYDALP